VNKALDYTAKGTRPLARKLDWRKKISDHVAWGLLVYTGLHIFVTMGVLNTGQGSILPYFSLIVLVGGIIPACRWVEKKWEGLSDTEAADPALAGRFRTHVALIWLTAFGLPFVLTGLFKVVLAAI